MLELKDATEIAYKAIKSLYADAIEFRVEEIFVPQPPDKPNWILTFGFTMPSPSTKVDAISQMLRPAAAKNMERVYKRVTLGSEGNLISIENRAVP